MGQEACASSHKKWLEVNRGLNLEFSEEFLKELGKSSGQETVICTKCGQVIEPSKKPCCKDVEDIIEWGKSLNKKEKKYAN